MAVTSGGVPSSGHCITARRRAAGSAPARRPRGPTYSAGTAGTAPQAGGGRYWASRFCFGCKATHMHAHACMHVWSTHMYACTCTHSSSSAGMPEMDGRTDGRTDAHMHARTLAHAHAQRLDHPSLFRSSRCGHGALPGTARGTPVESSPLPVSTMRPGIRAMRFKMHYPHTRA